jgi:excisionase family DNA binding protein
MAIVDNMARLQAEQSPQTVPKTVAEPLTLDDLRGEGVTINIERASEYLGVSRAFAYSMAKEGRLPIIKLGNRRMRVITAALLRMLSGED